jgi:hypothetical protein
MFQSILPSSEDIPENSEMEEINSIYLMTMDSELKVYLMTLNSPGQSVTIREISDLTTVAADALGAGQDWLSVNLTNIQFKGMSLERVTFNISTSKKYNWVANPPTPGIYIPKD